MTRPVLTLRHARNRLTRKQRRTTARLSPTTLVTAAALVTAVLATGVGSAPRGPVPLGPVTKVATTYQQMDDRAERHPDVARRLGHRMAANHGWRSTHQWRCLRRLWNLESSWRVHADNPNSRAYGIPQALPGRKMSSAGGHWWRSAQTQIRWGIRYVHARYDRPCQAMRHKDRHGWY